MTEAPPTMHGTNDFPWHECRVLVTGASGFIGSHVTGQLLNLGAKVAVLLRRPERATKRIACDATGHAGSLEDEDALRAAASGCSHLFHLAGRVRYDDDWATSRQANVDGTRRVITAARAAGVRRVIHTSSIVAVGASRRAEAIDEAAPWNLGHLSVPYITSKREGEAAALDAAGGPTEVVVVNPASVFGPDDPFASEFGTFCKRFWRGRIPVHFGGGNNCADVRDVATGHLLAAARGRAGRRYILGGTNMATPALFRALRAAAGKRIRWARLPRAAAPPLAALAGLLSRRRAAYLSPQRARVASLFWYYRMDRARRELGYRTRPLEETLADTHAYWMQ